MMKLEYTLLLRDLNINILFFSYVETTASHLVENQCLNIYKKVGPGDGYTTMTWLHCKCYATVFLEHFLHDWSVTFHHLVAEKKAVNKQDERFNQGSCHQR